MRVGINQSCQMGQTGFKILCDRFLTRLPYIVICRMIPQSTTVTKHPQLSGLSEQPFCLLLIWQSGPSSVRPFFCWARPWRPAACSWVSSGLGPARVLGCLGLSIQFHSISSTWPLHVTYLYGFSIWCPAWQPGFLGSGQGLPRLQKWKLLGLLKGQAQDCQSITSTTFSCFKQVAGLVQMQEHENGRHGSLGRTTMPMFQGICVLSTCHAM